MLRYTRLLLLLGWVLGAGQATAQGLIASGTPVGAGRPAAAIVPDSIYINPDSRPVFVGGDAGLIEYLRKNIHYPDKALVSHISGRVYVSFVLNREGRVTDAHVMKGPGYGLNEEALRLIWLMPTWTPAQQQGQPVRVACTIPINFESLR